MRTGTNSESLYIKDRSAWDLSEFLSSGGQIKHVPYGVSSEVKHEFNKSNAQSHMKQIMGAAILISLFSLHQVRCTCLQINLQHTLMWLENSVHLVNQLKLLLVALLQNFQIQLNVRIGSPILLTLVLNLRTKG